MRGSGSTPHTAAYSSRSSYTEGVLARGAELEVVSASDRLVCFGDGIEADALTISWGQRLRVAVSETRLRLVV